MHLVMLDTIIIFTEKVQIVLKTASTIANDHLNRSVIACPFGCGIVCQVVKEHKILLLDGNMRSIIQY